jgi:integrase
MVRMLIDCGLRRGELAGLHRKDVEPKQRTAFVEATTSATIPVAGGDVDGR